MDDHRSRLYEWLVDEVNRTLFLFAAATLLGLGSLLLFFYAPGNSPTRLHFVLLLGAMAILFYGTLRSDPV